MKSKNDSPSLELQLNRTNNFPSPNQEQNSVVSNNQSNNCEDKKSSFNPDSTEQGEINNFNISFFLPKDLNNIIEGDEDSPDNKINDKNTNNIHSPKPEQNNNNFNQENDFDFSKLNNNYSDSNQNNNFLNGQNIFPNFTNINKNIENNKDMGNNDYNFELHNLRMMDGGKNIFSTNTNINNFVINNSNQPISLQFNNANNSPFFNNILFSQNGSDFINYPQISNNQQIFNNQNGFINQNFINNNIINNNEFSNIYSQNQFQNKNIQTNNKQRKKKVIDEYTIEMFGRRGWICDLCNNFNYDTRKKCNRCHMLKKPKRIEEYLLGEKNKNLGHKHFWHCKFCGNYNYAFRLVCNRCQAKKDVA